MPLLAIVLAVLSLRLAAPAAPGTDLIRRAALAASRFENGLPPLPPDSTGMDTTVFVPGNWDSVMAAYDQSFRISQKRKFTPKFGIHYTKVEGVHLELGAGVRLESVRLSYLEGRYGYDFGRKRPTGLALIQADLIGGERLLLELGARDGVRPFGNNNPYGNTLFTLIAGYDTRQYLREREGTVLLVRHFSDERHVALGWVRTQQNPVHPVANFHLIGSDKWMDRNESVDPLVDNGIRLRLLRKPPYTGETVLTGLVVAAEATAYGGKLLHGTREFDHTEADLWYTAAAPHDGDSWEIRASGTLAGGRAPRQAWGDLGGAAGLMAFPPRGLYLSNRPEDDSLNASTAGTLIGTQRLFLRTEYRWYENPLSRSPIPVIHKLGLILVPFAEAGSVWGDPLKRPLLRIGDLRAPHLSEVHWDLGIGLRKDVGYSGILTQGEVDFAWPMGADTGPARITVRLSSNWLD